MRLSVVAACFALAACTHAGTAAPTAPKAPEAGIDKASLPARVLSAHGGRQVQDDAFTQTLKDADAVCIGEEHPNPHHHALQLELTRRLLAIAPAAVKIALGLEMIQRPFQGVVDDFVKKVIDRKALLGRIGWQERWGYDFDFYAPTIAAVMDRGGDILALNAPGELTHKVAKGGLEALSPDERAQLPELDLKNDSHRSWFHDATMGHGGPAEADFEHFYTAQVIWDETMADTAARWLAAGKAAGQHRQIVILAGTGHCMDAAIPARLRRRGVAKVVSIRPVVDDGGSAVSDALATPEGDYLVVLDASAAGEDSPTDAPPDVTPAAVPASDDPHHMHAPP